MWHTSARSLATWPRQDSSTDEFPDVFLLSPSAVPAFTTSESAGVVRARGLGRRPGLPLWFHSSPTQLELAYAHMAREIKKGVSKKSAAD